MKIRARFTLMWSVALLVLFGFFSVYQASVEGRKLDSQIRISADFMSGITAYVLRDPIYNFDTDQVANVARAFLADKSVYSIVVKDESGEEVFNEKSSTYFLPLKKVEGSSGFKAEHLTQFFSKADDKRLMFKPNIDESKIPQYLKSFYSKSQNASHDASSLIEVKKKVLKDGEAIGEVIFMFTEAHNNLVVGDKIRMLIIQNIIIVIIVLLMNAFLLQKIIITPINYTVSRLDDIAHGEGDLTQRLPVEGKDEINMLSEGFNTFVEKIRDIIVKVKDLASHLSAAAEEISSSTQQISDGVQQQSASFEEMTSSVQSNATTAQEANETSQETVGNVEAAGSGMENTIDAMLQIEGSSKRIAEAVSIITDIADQTNLLALNAAIEAARAGEHGKGFAVVADEVRKLAERSAASANEIKDVISGSAKQVQNGVELSREAGEGLKAIVEKINNIASQLHLISSATQEQATTMEENTSITEANSNATQQLAASSEELASQAESLNQLVAQFKV